MTPDSAEILRLLGSGQPQDRERAMVLLKSEFEPRIHALVKRMAGDRADPTHIFHDAILDFEAKVLNGGFKDNSDIWPLLRKIAENKIKDALRKDGRRKRNDASYRDFQQSGNQILENPAEKWVFSGEVVERMAKALQQLDPECRELLERYWFDGAALKDLLEELNAPSESALKKRHERCRKKLRDLLGDDPRRE